MTPLKKLFATVLYVYATFRTFGMGIAFGTMAFDAPSETVAPSLALASGLLGLVLIVLWCGVRMVVAMRRTQVMYMFFFAAAPLIFAMMLMGIGLIGILALSY